jgi:hypothetical protein
MGRCLAPQLSIEEGKGGVGAGNVYLSLSLTNRSAASCWLYGFPGILMLDAGGRPLPTHVVRIDGPTFPGISPTPGRVVLPPGAASPFFVHYGDVPSGGETSCPVADALLVMPPDETHQLRLATRVAPCQHGTMDVSPMQDPGTTI